MQFNYGRCTGRFAQTHECIRQLLKCVISDVCSWSDNNFDALYFGIVELYKEYQKDFVFDLIAISRINKSLAHQERDRFRCRLILRLLKLAKDKFISRNDDSNTPALNFALIMVHFFTKSCLPFDRNGAEYEMKEELAFQKQKHIYLNHKERWFLTRYETSSLDRAFMKIFCNFIYNLGLIVIDEDPQKMRMIAESNVKACFFQNLPDYAHCFRYRMYYIIVNSIRFVMVEKGIFKNSK